MADLKNTLARFGNSTAGSLSRIVYPAICELETALITNSNFPKRTRQTVYDLDSVFTYYALRHCRLTDR